MAQNYTRQSTFSDGDTITSSLFNDEYNQLVNVFTYSSTSASTTGHRHDGTAGQGGNIFKIGDLDFLNKIEVDSTNNRWGFYVEVSSAAVEQIRIQDGSVVPVTTNDIDLGTSSLQFKDLYIDGTANVDSLTLTSGSTVTTILDEDDLSSDSATALVTQQSVKAYVDAQVTAQDLDFQADSGGALSIDLDSEALTFTGGTGVDTSGSGNAVTFAIDSTVTTLTGSQTLTNKTLTSPDVNTPDIDGGTIDGTVIGGATPAAVSATTVSATGNITVGGTVDGRDVATDGTKLDGIEASADVTDTTNVTAAGAVMDSELTDIAAVKALNQGVATTDSPTFAGATVNGTVEFDGLSGTGAVTVTDILDQDNMSSNSATALATQQSIKSYVDSQVATSDTLAEVLANGNATGGTDVAFSDNDKAIFGAGSDLQIYHTGSQNYIEDAGTGNLNFKSNGNNFNFLDGSDNVVMQIDIDSETTLYHNTSAKLATSSTGIDVTGTATTDGLTIGATDRIYLDGGSNTYIQESASDDLRFFVGGSQAVRVRASGTDILGAVTADGAELSGNLTLNYAYPRIKLTDSDSNSDYSIINDNGEFGIYDDTNNAFRLKIDTNGNLDVGAVTADGLTVEAATPVIEIDSTTSANLATLQFATSGTVDSKITHQASTGVMTIDSGRNASWGGKIDFVTDTDTRMRIANNGDISFYEDTGTTAKFFWDSSAESLGIGTSSPSQDLEILNGTTGAGIRLAATDAAYWDIERDATSGHLTFTDDGAGTVLTVGQDGNVGIGTSLPSQKLTVSGNIQIEDNDGYLQFKDTNGGTNNKFRRIYNSEQTLYISRRNDDESLEANDLVIDSSGNVGIATSSPDTALHIEGSAPYLRTKNTSAPTDEKTWDYNAGTDGSFRFRATNDAGTDSNNWMVVDRSGVDINYIALSTGNQSETMRINSSGVVQISNSTPTLKFTDTDNNYDATIQGLSGSLVLTADSGAEFGTESIQFRTGGDEAMRIDSSQNLLVNRSSAFSTAKMEIQSDSGDASTLALNSIDTDGSILEFNKSGNTVGSIGTNVSRFYIHGSYGSGSGLRFDNASIRPATSTGTSSDATTDLGAAAARFKDLRLSGLAYTNGIVASDVDIVLQNSADGIYFGSGFFRPYSADDAVISLGSSTSRFKDLYLSGSITSGPNGGIIKEIGGDISLTQGAVGLRINEDASALSPTTASLNSDAAVDLGVSNIRFKDGHFSGNINANTFTAIDGVYIGGTGFANKLDDYEEGTWTPVFSRATTAPVLTTGTVSGRYTKVGRLVHATFFMQITGVTSSGAGQNRISLPFSSVGSTEAPSLSLYRADVFTTSITGQWSSQDTGVSSIRLTELGADGTASPVASDLNVGYLIGKIIYEAV